MIYLASPYSHPDPAVREERYQKALACVAEFARRKVAVYSPIVHWHEAAKSFELPTDAEFWDVQNTAMLNLSDKVVLLVLDGWQQSAGIEREFRLARELSIPIEYIHHRPK